MRYHTISVAWLVLRAQLDICFLTTLQNQLSGVRAAAKALGSSASREGKQVKKRVLSAAAKAKISRAAKRRWAKFRAQAKKVTKG